MRTIDAEALNKALRSNCKREICHDFDNPWCKFCCPHNDFEDLIENAPTVEAFTREELENWLYTICYNNIDGNEEDMKFAKHTEEIIRRLDGFERYVKDKREGKI